MGWLAGGCATVIEPTEIESQAMSFFTGSTQDAEIVVYVRKVRTTKYEVRGCTLAGANAIIEDAGDNGYSPQATALGGGGWNVSYTVTVIDDWEEVT